MKKLWKRAFIGLLTLAMLLCGWPAARADGTTLDVNFCGLIGQADGQWRTSPLTGVFDVYQDGTLLGQLEAKAEGGSSTVTLTGSGNATLVPDMQTMPDGYLIQESGYSISVQPARQNTAHVLVYADAGLFALQTDHAALFTLTNAAGEEALRFETDETGAYALPEALPSGEYVVTELGAHPAWEPFTMTLTPYRGDPAQITRVDQRYAVDNVPTATPTVAPTATPTATPTVAPTATPTATPTVVPTATPTVAPTATPTATPTVAPTATPTAAPTATPTPMPSPTPEPGVLTLTVTGDVPVRFALANASGTEVASGEAMTDVSAEVDALMAGDYVLTLSVGEGAAITAVNGEPMWTFEPVSRTIRIASGENGCTVGATLCGRLGGSMADVADDAAQVLLTGPQGTAEAAVSAGRFASDWLRPGRYTVTISLPAGEYSGEGWRFDASAAGATASCEVEVTGGEESVLPEVKRETAGAVSGRAMDSNGAALVGSTVELLDENGAVAYQTRTAQDGTWLITDVVPGAYVVRASAPEGFAMPNRAVTVIAGRETAGVEQTATEASQIQLSVFIDANNNGECGTYERPLSGVRAAALSEDGVEIAAGETDAEGQLTLVVPAGTYRLRTMLPADYGYGKQGKELRSSSSVMALEDGREQQSEPFEVSGEVRVGVGARSMAAVSGTAWLDLNGDGIWQEDEPGQSGVLVEMIGEKNGQTYQSVSDETGAYRVSQVRPGTYKLRVTTPDGLMFTKYSKIGGQRRSIITTEGKRTDARLVIVDVGEEKENQNIGVVTDGVVTGVCFLDANYNGYYDEGEPPLPGVELELIKKNNGNSVATVTSGEDGRFTFVAVRANQYRLRALLPKNGETFTVVTADENGNQFRAREGRREFTIDNVTVETGGRKELVVGAILPATISGVAYLDDNFTGTMDGREKTVSGLTVSLKNAAGETVATDRTNAKGRYVFDGVAPGEYTLSLTAKSGYAFTRQGEGNVILNRSGGAGESEAFSVTLGQTLDTMDIGMILPGVVEGMVFADRNDNGLRDAEENGLAGTVVRLMSEEGEMFSATIGESGTFRFDAVMPGRYYVRYELPENGLVAQVKKDGNAVSGEGGVAASDWFDFAAGDERQMPLCGGLTLGEISGVAFRDHQGDGAMDGGDAPLAGVTLTLTPSRADLTEVTATTGADGVFCLSALHPDAYTLTVTFPDGMVMSRADAVALPVKAGENTVKVSLDIAMGDRMTEQRLGGVAPASMSGQAWLDENNDGVMDASERARAAGLTVTVVDQATGEEFSTLIADENGAFATDGLIPGLYTLRYTLDGATVAPKAGDSTFMEANGALTMTDISVDEGAAWSGARLGIVRYTTLGGGVWIDRGDAVEALPGAEVALTDASGAQVASVVSGEDGRYAFEGLLPGDYTLHVVLPDGQVVVEPGDARLGAERVSVMTDCDRRQASSDSIPVVMGEDQLALDIGAVLLGRLGDLCWLDLNGNGLQDSDEGGVPGVTVTLLRDGEEIASTVSDQYGFYFFDNVYPAVYTLRADYPAEVVPTALREDFPIIASVLTDSGESAAVTVQSNRANRNADLGFRLVKDGVYPAGYGAGASQDWTRRVTGE